MTVLKAMPQVQLCLAVDKWRSQSRYRYWTIKGNAFNQWKEKVARPEAFTQGRAAQFSSHAGRYTDRNRGGHTRSILGKKQT